MAIAHPSTSVGHPSGFPEFYRSCHGRLKALIRRMVGDAGPVEDLVQETFARALASGQELRPGTHPWPWLATIARNLCIDELRRRRRDEVELFRTHGARATGDPQDMALDELRRREVIDALVAIGPRHGRLLVGKHLDGHRYSELAAAEGTSVEAVKSAVARARKRFRDRYREIAERSTLAGVAMTTGWWARLRASVGRASAVAARLPSEAFSAAAPAAGNMALAVAVATVLVATPSGSGAHPHDEAPHHITIDPSGWSSDHWTQAGDSSNATDVAPTAGAAGVSLAGAQPALPAPGGVGTIVDPASPPPVEGVGLAAVAAPPEPQPQRVEPPPVGVPEAPPPVTP